MELVLKIIIGVFTATFLGMGIRSMFMPENMGKAVGLSSEGAAGLSEIRGVLGGFFLASVAMLVLGLVAANTMWFLAVAILMGGVAIGRLVGIVADGFEKKTLMNVVIELVIGGVLVTAHFVLG